MDVFSEQLVKRQKSGKDLLVTTGVVVLASIISYISFAIVSLYVSPFLGVILTAGSIFGAYLLISRQNLEYEYIVTTDIIDFDKIIAKKRRKRVATTSIRNFTKYGEYTEKTPKFNGKTFDLSSNGEEAKYFAEFSYGKKGNIRVVFSPNEKTLKNMKPYLKHSY